MQRLKPLPEFDQDSVCVRGDLRKIRNDVRVQKRHITGRDKYPRIAGMPQTCVQPTHGRTPRDNIGDNFNSFVRTSHILFGQDKQHFREEINENGENPLQQRLAMNEDLSFIPPHSLAFSTSQDYT